MKRMHKLIVMSATYQQSSRATPELLAKDPENRLLARGPRVRLEAEVIRDAALQASGLLSERDRRAERLPAAAGGRHDRGNLRRARLEDQPGRRPLSPRPVHLHQAHRSVRDGDDLRRAQRRGLRRPPRGLQYAAPGADALERPGLRGGRAGAGPIDGRDGRVRGRAGRCPVPPLPQPRPRIATSCRSSRSSFKRRNGGSSSRSSTPPRSPAPATGEASERAAWTVLARVLLNLDEAVTKG